MSEAKTSYLSAGRYGDESDLLELLQDLWAQKLLVFLVTLFGLTASAGYAYFAPEKFKSGILLAPPSITALAPFVRHVNMSSDPAVNILETALTLSDNVITLLGRSLLAPRTQSAFISEHPSFSDCIVTSSQNRSSSNKISVSVTCQSRENSLLALDGYIEFASRIAAQEFQALMLAVGVENSIRMCELYSVESPSSTTVTPNKNLILGLGIVLGGMLGVFAALIRIMLKNCKKSPKQPVS